MVGKRLKADRRRRARRRRRRSRRVGRAAGDARASLLRRMSFDATAARSRQAARRWEEWERGETPPGKVLANLKTAGHARRAAPAGRERLEPPLREHRRGAAGGDQRRSRGPQGGVRSARRRAGAWRTGSVVGAADAAASADAVALGQPPSADDVPLFPAPARPPCWSRSPTARRARGAAHPPLADLRSHRGEISFPGGRVDAGRDARGGRAAGGATRRWRWSPRPSSCVGRLPPLATMVSRSYIVPVVGRLRGRPVLRPAAAEVERILWVPLRRAGRPDTVPRGAVGRRRRWRGRSSSSSSTTRPSGARRPACCVELLLGRPRASSGQQPPAR